MCHSRVLTATCFICLLLAFKANAASSFNAEEAITPTESVQITNGLRQQIQRNYFARDLVPQVTEAIASIDLSSIETRQQLTQKVTQVLHQFDKHLALVTRTNGSGKTSSQAKEPWFTQLARKNTGVRKVEVLPGNIGYLDYWGFDKLNERSTAKLAAAFSLLENTDALIIDLRENGGGDSPMLSYFSSYFVPSGTLLSTYQFLGGSRYNFYTRETLGAPIYQQLPLYILVSKSTFSAGESLAYTFKHLKRATIIGEVTKGGANPVNTYSLSHGFKAFIPNSSIINPITQSNWEGVGVQPHYRVSAEQALAVAYQQALKQQLNTVTNPFLLREIKRQLNSE